MSIGKIEYWLTTGLNRFKKRFWIVFSEYSPLESNHGRLIINLAISLDLKPFCPFAPIGDYKSKGKIIDRNRALKLILKIMARLEVENNSDLAGRIVLETVNLKEAHNEIGKLANVIKRAYSKKPSHLGQELAIFRADLIHRESDFGIGKMKGSDFFARFLESYRNLKMIIEWRYFIAARNYEKTIHAEDYSICKLSLHHLELEMNQIEHPGNLLKLLSDIGKFQENPNWVRFKSLLEVIDESKKKKLIQDRELADSYRILMNFLIRRINSRDERILIYAKRLFLENIYNGLLLIKRKILARDLKSILSIFIRQEDFDSAKKFFHRYGDHILDDPNRMAWRYNNAVLLFSQKEFEEAGDLFQQVMHSSEDYYLKIDGKIYALRCLIELQVKNESHHVKFFPGSWESFKKFFLRQRDLPEKTYRFCISFVALMAECSDIWQLPKDYRKDKWNSLRLKVDRIDDEHVRKWLLGVIDRCLAFSK